MRKWYPAVLITAAVVFSLVVYGRLPETIATHWGANGQPNGWSSRAFGAFVMPCTMLLLWGVMRGLPKIDPRAANYEKFPETYDLIVNGTQTLLAALHVAIVGVALGWDLPMYRLGPATIGVLFLGLGYVLPNVRSNWWIGIRTPWTLSSDTVWGRTHRVGSYLMTAAGVACLATIALPASWTRAVILTAVSVAAFGSVVYSYVIWRGEQRR